MTDVEVVGGKNASLGEMIRSSLHQGVRWFPVCDHGACLPRVPSPRAWTPASGAPGRAGRGRRCALAEAGRRSATGSRPSPFRPTPPCDPSAQLTPDHPNASVLRGAPGHGRRPPGCESFAGQQETFLNVMGIDEVLHKMRVFASSTTTSDQLPGAQGALPTLKCLSAGVQRMVRSGQQLGRDVHARHRMGFRDVVFITIQLRPGETVVQGASEPR